MSSVEIKLYIFKNFPSGDDISVMVFFPLHTFHFPHHRLLTAAFTHALSSPPRLLCLTLQSHTFPIQSAATLCVTGIKTNECIVSRRCQSLHHIKGGGGSLAVISFLPIMWYIYFFSPCAWQQLDHIRPLILIRNLWWGIFFLAREPSSFPFILCDSVLQLHSPKMGVSSLAWPSILDLLY